MTILTLQDTRLEVRERSFRLRPHNLTSRGLFSQAISPYGPVDQRWVAELTYPPQEEADWRYWDGFLAGRDGMTGKLRAYDPARRQPRYNSVVTTTTENWDDATTWDDGTGWESGTLPPYVSAGEAAQRGETDLLLQFPGPSNDSPPVSGYESLSAVLRSGDLFEIRPNGVPADYGHLYVVTGTGNTDASGQTRVTFRPGLRAGVATGDMVVLTDPMTVFRLASDDVGDMTVDTAQHAALGLSLIEVLPES